jgi:uncharacterized protein YyaL (SSP411 family)
MRLDPGFPADGSTMPNRLAAETSPYLRQHADNPVDWQPWGPAALREALEADKPILLSIGYSACHWCHVMAHESFEDPAIAAVMNRCYVNIKVDREERPDLDQIYQSAHQVMTGRAGGWPLTVLLTPQQVPFYAGTYFPPSPRHGLPAFGDLLERAAGVFRQRREELESAGSALTDTLRESLPSAAGGETTLDAAPVRKATAALDTRFDPRFGGFGRAPKFPQPQLLAFCLRRRPEAALLTLRRMADGGIYDQVGGGFFRYAVDGHWSIPHFEKMLYDNGLLLAVYSDAYALTGDPIFARVVRETIGWATRELGAPQGGFYAALDADTDGKEGRTYVWQRDEVVALLDGPEFEVVASHFGLGEPPNFESSAWHLHIAKPLDEVAHGLGRPAAETQALLDGARAKLAAARVARPQPGRDDKILTGWNALMIRGLARAARVFDRQDWLEQARRTADFIRRELVRADGLYATWQRDGARYRGYLDDHAFLLDATLELLQAGFRRDDLDFARTLGNALLKRFEDPEHGGFFLTAHDHERLLYRPKSAEDQAIPSGNGVAAGALLRLSRIVDEPAFERAAARTLRVFRDLLRQAPEAATTLVTALDEMLDPPRVVVLRGPAASLRTWQVALDARYRPDLLVIALDNDQPLVAGTFAATLAQPPCDQPTAFVCRGTTCLPAITDLAALLAQIE